MTRPLLATIFLWGRAGANAASTAARRAAARLRKIFLVDLRRPTVCPVDPTDRANAPVTILPRIPAPACRLRRCFPARVRGSWRVLMGVGLLLPSTLSAADATRQAFDIPAGNAGTTLKRFAAQANAQLLYSPDDVEGVQTLAVQGMFVPLIALERMLTHTPLKARQDEKTLAIAITRQAPSRAPPAPRDRPIRAPETTPFKPIEPTSVKPRSLLSALAGWLVAGAAADAQTTAALPADDKGTALTLSPFQVNADRTNGYTAEESLAGGRLATKLLDTPSALTVMTKEFLDDIAANSSIEAAGWAPNSIPLYADTGAKSNTHDYLVQMRNFNAGGQFRNYFTWAVNSDAFSFESLDFARGPNSIVYGDGATGGLANVNTKRARQRNFTELQYRVSSYGGDGRFTFDLNRRLNDQVAFRIAGVRDRNDGWEDQAKAWRDGILGTVTVDFTKQTQFRANYEWGKVRRVVNYNPLEQYSAWDGVYTVSAVLTPDRFPAAATGARRYSTDMWVYNPAEPQAGLQNWLNFGTTNGTLRQLETRVPAHVANPATYPKISDWAFGYNAPNNFIDQPYYEYSAFLEHRFGKNLFAELAYSYYDQHRFYNQIFWQAVLVDINRVMPDGRNNPHFGEKYTETSLQSQSQGNRAEEFRAGLVYRFEHKWAREQFLAIIGRRDDIFEADSFQPGITNNPAVPNIFNAVNRINIRRYEIQRDVPFSEPPASINGRTIRTARNGGSIQDQIYNYLQLAATGSLLPSGRLKNVIGFRRTWRDRQNSGANTIDPVTGEVLAIGALATTIKDTTDRSTLGFVYQLKPWLGVSANYGENFQPTGGAFDIAGGPLASPSASGFDYGLKFNLWEGKVSGSASYYTSTQINNRTGGPATQINQIWADLGSNNTVFPGYQDTFSNKARGLEVALTANLNRQWRTMFNIAFPRTRQTGGFSATRAYYAAHAAAWRAGAADAGNPNATRIASNLQAIETTLSNFAEGRAPNNSFKYTANVFTNYQWSGGRLKGLSVGGGVQFRGARLVTNLPTGPFDYIWASPYQLVTLTAAYRTKLFGADWTGQVNISNLLDDEFPRYNGYANFTVNGVTQFVGQRNFVQAPRQFQFTLTTRF